MERPKVEAPKEDKPKPAKPVVVERRVQLDVLDKLQLVLICAVITCLVNYAQSNNVWR